MIAAPAFHLFKAVADLMVKTAREITEPARKDLPNLKTKRKADGSVVTEADEKAEAFLTAWLRRLLPGSFVLGEESVAGGKGWESPLINYPGYVWTLDPIDGTRSFETPGSNGEGGPYGIMIALRHNGRTIAAWIYYPKTGDLLFASKDDACTKYIRNYGTSEQTIEDIAEIPVKPIADITLVHNPARDKIPETYGLNEVFQQTHPSVCLALEVREMVLNGTRVIINHKVKSPWDFEPITCIAKGAGAPAPRMADGKLYADGSETFILAPREDVMRAVLGKTSQGLQPRL